MVEEFRGLPLRGAFIRDFVISPKKKILLSLMIPAAKVGEPPHTTKSYDVQFNKVADFEVNVSAAPWLEIKSHEVSTTSALIDRFLARERVHSKAALPRGPLLHFEIMFDEGHLSLIAETCTVSFTEELPAFDS